MECHCKDHLPGEWHSHKDCDCASHEHPTYTFVITKVMEEDPGTATVYVSKDFMEKLEVKDGDTVEIVGANGGPLQVRSHPNPWVDTRMVSLDKTTMTRMGFALFSQVKLRKTCCGDVEEVALEVPEGANISRRQLQAMLDRAEGSVVRKDETITLKTDKGAEVCFKVVRCEPDDVARLTKRTRVDLLDSNGDKHVCKRETGFKDVGGLKEAIRKVKEVVQLPLRHPEIFHQLGMDPPRGVLLHGPSGTGKTLIARAVAGETGCYFMAVSGTEIMDKHYGESEAKLRAAFEEAEKRAPAIIFIDEIDALAPRRDKAEGEVERRVTAQLLALMDGLEDRGSIIVLAATNLPNVLDVALRRPGRFDREVLIPVPDKKGRREIFEIHTQLMPLGKDLDLEELAEKSHGFVGADIRAVCQEAGYKALRRILPGLEETEEKLTEDFIQAISVDMEDFQYALSEMHPSSARSFELDLSEAGWDRIAGYAKERAFIKEIVLWPLQHVSELAELGVKRLTGLLITGPSGVGKTLTARTLAKESGFNCIEIRGSELISKYMGESERNVRELFRQAQQMAPTVVILDGIEAMTSSGWSDSKLIDRVVNQLVMEMNAINTDKPVLVVAVASRAGDLPPALTATGRFSTELRLKIPDKEDLEELFAMRLKAGKVDCSGDLGILAERAGGLTGADVTEICRRLILQAARVALEEKAEAPSCVTISQDDALKAIDRWKSAPEIHGAQ